MQALDCPFRKADEMVEKLRRETDIIFVDVHAEATSEKVALGWHLDGRVSAIIGTHTHEPTADERILPKGTAYVTDAGMTGGHDGVIGMDMEAVLKRFLTGMPQKFETAEGDVRLNAVVVDVDEKSGKAKNITRMTQSV
jgi:metallophosphoesterase (TIGR00282 family)